MSNPYSGESSNLYYVGEVTYQLLGGAPRFLYALRRVDEGSDRGTLYLNRFDQLSSESFEINTPGGDPNEDYVGFAVGSDYYENRREDGTIEYENAKYEQWRWDQRYIAYYINSEGYLVARVGQDYAYPATLQDIYY